MWSTLVVVADEILGDTKRDFEDIDSVPARQQR